MYNISPLYHDRCLLCLYVAWVEIEEHPKINILKFKFN